MMSSVVRFWRGSGLARCARAFGDPASVCGGAALVGVFLILLFTATQTRLRTPSPAAAHPGLVSVTRTNGPSLHHPYPRGQFEADLRTLVNMMRFVLTPEPPDFALRSATTA